ncbi:MAG: DcaP family trimeric outer membrane transporter [Planctomycetota bacterium]
MILLLCFANAAAGQEAAPAGLLPFGGDAGRFRTLQFDRRTPLNVANDFNEFPEFEGGILVVGEDAAMKISGFVKADFISDFDPINSTDSFDTTTIPVDVADRNNARFHARQSRLSFDTRWRVNGDIARAFLEADFFGSDVSNRDALRLRHAYGTLGWVTVGQTWTTFTDPSAVPSTLDFEGAVSNVNRRQGLLRLELPLLSGLTWAIALEDPRISIDAPSTIDGTGRTESPDFINRLRFEADSAEFQAAMVVRKLGFQRTDQPVVDEIAYGFNFTGSALIVERTKLYSQITFGDGIGSYRGSNDVVSTGPDSAELLPMFGWMIGIHHEWNDHWTSNVTFSELILDDLDGQQGSNLRSTEYLAVNFINNPYERVFWGAEYLYGSRQNQDGHFANAHRLQLSVGFYLP